MEQLELQGLCFRYASQPKTQPDILKKIDLQVQPGELLAIIGHTGSGKSTLMQHLNALLKPTSGMVLFDGKSIWGHKRTVRAARFCVGLCFQYPEYQLFEETVEKDIAFGPRNMGLAPGDVQARVQRAMHYVGLPACFASKAPFDLSGGEKRRVAIAGVLAMEPQVLVLDEPTAGLDPAGRTQILQMLQQYRRDTGRTLLLVSHNMDEVAALADRVLVLQKGEVQWLGSPAEVFAHAEALQGMGLDVPLVTRVFLELKRRGLPVRTDVFDADQACAELVRVLAHQQEGAPCKP